jgi:hypothetical protein
MKRHYDQAAVDAAVEQVLAYQRAHAAKSDMAGLTARIQIDVLPPLVRAMIREINAGATEDQIGKAMAALVANIILTTTDSTAGPALRAEAVSEFYANLKHCLDYANAIPEPERSATAKVRPTPAGHA